MISNTFLTTISGRSGIRPHPGGDPGTGSTFNHQNQSIMEFLNKVELQGIVGSASKSKVGDETLIRFAVATNLAYKKDEDPVIETTWHQVSAFSGKIVNGPTVKMGDRVYVSGRIRSSRYMDSDGVENVVYEIVANKVRILYVDRLDYPRQ